MTEMTDEQRAEAQRKAKKLAEEMAERRFNGPAGTPGTLGDNNSNRSIGDTDKPMRTLGLDDKPPR